MYHDLKIKARKYLSRDNPLRKALYKGNRALAWLRRLKGSWGVLPDFLIIGTQKGGTTSLYNYLLQHPAVHGATGKETGYFLNSEPREEEYRAYFPLEAIKAIHQNLLVKAFYTGEASTAYLFDENVPKRVKAVLRGVKLIVLLRRPTERAFSAYKHWKGLGQEKRTFSKAIEEEFKKYNHGGPTEFEYIRRGLYDEQLSRWLNHFGREQFFIERSEKMFENPQQVYDNLLQFLGLASHEISSFPVVNKGSDETMSQKTEQRLRTFYQPHNEKLFERLDWEGWDA